MVEGTSSERSNLNSAVFFVNFSRLRQGATLKSRRKYLPMTPKGLMLLMLQGIRPQLYIYACMFWSGCFLSVSRFFNTSLTG